MLKKLKRIFASKSIKLIFPFVWIGLIFGLSFIPNLDLPFIFKIIGHILGYAVFTFSLIVAIEICLFKVRKPDFFLKTLLLTITSLILAFLIALSNEFLQTFIPGRGGCLKDVGIDSIGMLIAATVWCIIKFRKNKKMAKLSFAIFEAHHF